MFWVKIREEAVKPLNNVPLDFNRAIYDQGSHDAKVKLGSGGIRTHASEETST